MKTDRTFTPIAPSPSDGLNLLSISSEHRIRSENLPFDIDVWYPLVKEHTFPTSFLPLTLSEGSAIVNHYETFYNQRPRLTGDDVQILRALEKRIQHELNTNPNFKNGAFLRLCGRSPKDGEPLVRSQVLEKYNKDLEDLYREGAPQNANTKLRAIAKSTYLKVTSGAEAMNLLLTSERVFTDLHDWLRYGEPEQIVLRKWHPEMSLEYEFRVFVNNNQINAISQYDHYCEYPHLSEIKNKVQQLILNKWAKIHPYVGESSYIIDFLYDPKEESVTMIELSPFRTCTGTALFNWVEDRDVLYNGPVEFRIKEGMHPYIKELVEANWEDRWNSPVDRYDSIYSRYEQPKSWTDWLWSFFYSNKASPKNNYLFVYGTLKKDFYWNKKFLSNADFVGEAVTTGVHALVVGESGVPYLLSDVDGGKQVAGEVWCVDDESLRGLDEYEGVTKEYYDRKTIEVKLKNGSIVNADAYFKVKSGELKTRPLISEYTKTYHEEHYKPINHIHVKQLQYLSEEIGVDRS